MTTATYSSVLDQSTDAGFRALGSELATHLAGVGLVQTADTGQINWASVNRAAAGAIAGYSIWRFADSSIYIKFEFGSNGQGQNFPSLFITVGKGSNGSGTLTGQLSTRKETCVGLVPSSTVTAYNTYVCHTADAFSLCWKNNSVAGGYAMAVTAIGKTVDNAGAATATGYGVFTLGQQGLTHRLQYVRTASVAESLDPSDVFTFIPGNVTTGVNGADTMVYPFFLQSYPCLQFAWMFGYVIADIAEATVGAVAMVGAVSHSYITLGQLSSAAFGKVQNSGNYGYAILFE